MSSSSTVVSPPISASAATACLLPAPSETSARQSPDQGAVWKGHSIPLGATWTGEGVNFALFSENATGVELCLFDQLGAKETRRIRLPGKTGRVWHGFIPELRPGQLYGYRVEGPFEPERGHRFNANKLLLDPYAKAIAGRLDWADDLFGYKMGSEAQDLSFDERDTAELMPKAVVIDSEFPWGTDEFPKRALDETVTYEVHVRGFSKLWEVLPEELRGTYAGLGSPAAIEYFKRLGVTAIELLPVHYHAEGKHLVDKGLSDYWGYNTLGFFAPEPSYASQPDPLAVLNEFKAMVRSLHAAGLEVILDVVYNHTAEGNQNGPTLSFRGIDNAAYYRLVGDQPRYYMDYTGTGNTLNVPHPEVLKLIMDSLRYWVTEMHVDGFRFDLAPALARGLHEVSRLSSFFDVIHQDPVISQVKLIAEPWDVGEGGYQVGNFPVLWAEWNGRYRDTVRRYWKGDAGHMRDFAYRLCGSSDLYQGSGKTPTASINFVTAHDGFTLRDLVSFNDKHNDANGENNQDGDNNNNSWNCGHEGLDAPAEVQALRRRMQRNFLVTLMLSQGVPMLRAGDEYGATQNGNNNAYCQDNEISWLSWQRDEKQKQLEKFTAALIDLRLKHPIFHQYHFFHGRDLRGDGVKDITWINADGQEMSDEAWAADYARVVGVMLSGDAIQIETYFGQRIDLETFLLFFNAHHEAVEITLPGQAEFEWNQVIDTSLEAGFVEPPVVFKGGARHALPGRSFALFHKRTGSDDNARDTARSERKKRIEAQAQMNGRHAEKPAAPSASRTPPSEQPS